MAEAACRGEPIELFFPGKGGSMTRARELCTGCPVMGECLSYADADEDLDRWWGGTSGRQRARLRRAVG